MARKHKNSIGPVKLRQLESLIDMVAGGQGGLAIFSSLDPFLTHSNNIPILHSLLLLFSTATTTCVNFLFAFLQN
jgi:hypothetical protein